MFVCIGGDVKKLDFRFFAGNKKIGAPFHGLKAFFTTGQLNVLDKVSQLTSPLLQEQTCLGTLSATLLRIFIYTVSCSPVMLLALQQPIASYVCTWQN